MELQLGLALPTNPITTNGFDLNSHGYDPIEVLGSDPLTGHLVDCCSSNRDSECKKKKTKKRCFDEAIDHQQDLNDVVPRTLPLFHANKNNEDGVVGWPPIKPWRKKICNENRTAENGFPSNYKYVKVKMEGVPIARKVDLSVHHCYETLTETLVGMFGKCEDENLKDYKLTYQDKEGDWLLAGDIPWRTFTQSVQRLKLLRSGN